MTPPARHARALVVLSAVTLFTGASFVLFKASILSQQPFATGESSWFISAHNLAPRFAFGVLCLLAWYRGRVLRLTSSEWRQAVFMAVASFLGCMLQTDGLQRTSAATTAFLTQFYVILIPLWWALQHRKRPPVIVLFASVLVLAGVSVLARVDWREFRIGRGEAEVLLSTAFFSILLVSLNWPGFAANRAECTSTGMFIVEGSLFALVSLLTVRDPAHLVTPFQSPGWVSLVIVAAVLGTAGPFVLLNHWQRFVTPVEAGLLYSFGPVVAALTEVFAPAYLSRWAGLDYPNQPLTLTLITGGALVLAANVLIQAGRDGRQLKVES
jgi:drug/metabolite transporter (DMT)-like permease